MLKTAYQRAAIAYLVYGCVYMGGAVAEILADETRQKSFFGGHVPWWAFYVVGALLIALMPVLVWKRYKWLTRILAFGPAGKAITLFWLMGKDLREGGGLDAYSLIFAFVAVGAACLLAYAGWTDDGEDDGDDADHSNAETPVVEAV